MLPKTKNIIAIYFGFTDNEPQNIHWISTKVENRLKVFEINSKKSVLELIEEFAKYLSEYSHKTVIYWGLDNQNIDTLAKVFEKQLKVEQQKIKEQQTTHKQKLKVFEQERETKTTELKNQRYILETIQQHFYTGKHIKKIASNDNNLSKIIKTSKYLELRMIEF